MDIRNYSPDKNKKESSVEKVLKRVKDEQKDFRNQKEIKRQVDMEKFLRRQNYDKSVRNQLLNNQYNKDKSNWDYLKNPKEIEIMK